VTDLLYTGITRGKRLVVLVGQNRRLVVLVGQKALAIAVRNVSGRFGAVPTADKPDF
jgi:hypothetical protein